MLRTYGQLQVTFEGFVPVRSFDAKSILAHINQNVYASRIQFPSFCDLPLQSDDTFTAKARRLICVPFGPNHQFKHSWRQR